MATANGARISVELGQTKQASEVLTDAGNGQVFNFSSAVVSRARDFSVMPNGLVTGADVVNIHTTDDMLSVDACSANVKGVLVAVAAGTVTIVRPATSVAKICSIIIDDAGALAVIAGTDSTDAAFSAVRGAAGGPPFIPADAVELEQFGTVSSVGAVVLDAELLKIDAERADFPVFDTNLIGRGSSNQDVGKTNSFVEFNAQLPDIHDGGTPKRTYAEYYTPSFMIVPRCSEWSPADRSDSISSEDTYDGPVSSTSSSIGQAGFKALLIDAIIDPVVQLVEKFEGQMLTVKVWPNPNKSPYQLTQGFVALSRSYPSGKQINASFTVTPEVKTASFVA